MISTTPYHSKTVDFFLQKYNCFSFLEPMSGCSKFKSRASKLIRKFCSLNVTFHSVLEFGKKEGNLPHPVVLECSVSVHMRK